MTDSDVLRALAEQARALTAGRLDEARRGFRTLTEAHPEEAAAWSGLARASHALGDLRAAVSAWQQLAELSPTAWQPWSDLGAAWTEMRELERAARAFDRAEALSPNELLLGLNRATLELRSGDTRAAIARLERSVASHPRSAPAHASLGLALRDAGRAAEAVPSLERAVALSPDTALYACGLGRALLESGNAARALETAAAYLRRRPGHSGARALEMLACSALGHAEAVRGLLDYERLVSVSPLALPAGFVNREQFDTALSEHCVSHPTLLGSPLSHATARGLHSGSLLVEPRGPITAFANAISAAASAYARALATSNPAHPVVRHRARSVFLRMWCVVLHSGGHQIPHIHPEAWLSGVYYPQIPRGVRENEAGAGALEFGETDAPHSPDPTESSARPMPRASLPKLRIRPEEGLLVLFPSYFYHRTLPFEAEGTRVSVAFDFVALG